MYDLLISEGDQGGTRTVNIWLYPNRPNDFSTGEGAITDALDTAYSQLLSENVIDYFQVKIYEAPTGFSVSGETVLDKIEDYAAKYWSWIEGGNKFGIDFTESRGIHMGICNEFDFGSVDNGCIFSNNDDNIKNGLPAYVGTAGPEQKYRNFAAQESLHGLIKGDHPQVLNYTNGEHQHEHDLGMKYGYKDPGWGGPVSPLATLYEGSGQHPSGGQDIHAHHDGGGPGCATESYWNGGYTRDLTECTIEAVDYTAEYFE